MNETNNYELRHHGVKGMKWGVRRFQKVGGGLTPAGRKRYSDESSNNKSSSGNDPKGIAKKYNAGKKLIDAKKAKKVMAVVSSAAAVTSGALWVASALIPGPMSIASNSVAAIANVVSIATAQK